MCRLLMNNNRPKYVLAPSIGFDSPFLEPGTPSVLLLCVSHVHGLEPGSAAAGVGPELQLLGYGAPDPFVPAH